MPPLMDPTRSTSTEHDEEEVKTHALNEKLRGIARQVDLQLQLHALYETLDHDPKILDQIDKIPFIHTPLHEAAEAGQTCFAVEILSLKPSFGRKLNTNGQSPLHLALHHTELAKRLIAYDSELIRVKGREQKTPLHHVAEAGDTDLLAEFLCACPESIKDLTIHDETAFHIAVRMGRVSAFRLIFEWIWRRYDGELLIRKDGDGNTVLHIAVATKQDEIVDLLVRKAPIIKKEKNSQGLTALDIADDHEEGIIRKILLGSEKARPRPLLPPPPPPHEGTKDAPSLHNFLLSPERSLEQVLRFILYCRRDLSLDMRNMVLVVAVLIATATYEALGSLSDNQSSKSSTSTGTTSGKNLFTVGKEVGNVAYYFINTISFTSSVAVMILVLSSKPFTSFLHLSLMFLALSYGYKMLYISAWQTAFPVSLIALVYTSKLYFKSIERAIRMEIPAIWMGIYPRWHPWPPVPGSLERLRMVYRLMNGLRI